MAKYDRPLEYHRGGWPQVSTGDYSAIEHRALSRWFGRDPKHCWMMMLTCYFDRSGEGGKRAVRAFSVGGYVSTVAEWIAFDKEWNKLLARNGVRYFHMKEFAPSTGQFSAWKGQEARRREFLQQLVKITRKHVLRSFSVTLGMDLYNVGNDHFVLEEANYTPLLICGGTCVEKALKWKDTKFPAEPMMFYFEEGEEGWGNFRTWVKARGYPCDSAPKLPDPGKPFDFPLTPFQAADFVAWEVRKLYDETISEAVRNMRGSLEQLTTIPHDWGVFDMRQLRRFISRNEVTPRKFPRHRLRV